MASTGWASGQAPAATRDLAAPKNLISPAAPGATTDPDPDADPADPTDPDPSRDSAPARPLVFANGFALSPYAETGAPGGNLKNPPRTLWHASPGSTTTPK